MNNSPMDVRLIYRCMFDALLNLPKSDFAECMMALLCYLFSDGEDSYDPDMPVVKAFMAMAKTYYKFPEKEGDVTNE